MIRDSRWNIFYNDISLEEFTNDKIPKIEFKPEVNPEIVESFKLVRKLLIHSYFEYQFLDLAVTKSLHLFEMAMKLRYSELNGSAKWKSNAPLQQLIDWFRTREYFEIEHESFFKQIRFVRNHLTHPERNNLAGTVGLPWLNTVIDLINDLYEDINLRKERKRLEFEFHEQLTSFLKNGAKIKLPDGETYIYSQGSVVVNNKVNPIRITFSLLPVFDVNSSFHLQPIVINVNESQFNFDSDEIELMDINNDLVLIKKDLDEFEQASINLFRSKVNEVEAFRIQHSFALFDLENYNLRLRRTIRLVI
jgi:hypothetical protein